MLMISGLSLLDAMLRRDAQSMPDAHVFAEVPESQNVSAQLERKYAWGPSSSTYSN
jgi:hypothetical protein